jgi:small subunit ribosomal protein S1
MNVKMKHENTAPLIDEGWWQSVLAEENRYSAANQRPGAASKPEVRREAGKEPPEAQPQVNWDHIRDLYMKDHIVTLKVTGHNRGGLLVEGENITGFVPLSHLVALAGKESNERNHDLEAYLGATLRLKVIECAPEDGRVVFSERAAQSEPGKRAELFHSLHAGQSVSGTVTNVTDFGVFVDLGGVEGLVHISELSWGRVNHPTQFVTLGNPLEVQVLDLAPERCRVALSLKRLMPNPWKNAASEFPVGSIHNATITSVLSYGVFARLDSFGVEGLVHASEIPHEEGVVIRDILTDGQAVQVRILHLDPAHHRLGFSMRFD